MWTNEVFSVAALRSALAPRDAQALRDRRCTDTQYQVLVSPGRHRAALLAAMCVGVAACFLSGCESSGGGDANLDPIADPSLDALQRQDPALARHQRGYTSFARINKTGKGPRPLGRNDMSLFKPLLSSGGGGGFEASGGGGGQELNVAARTSTTNTWSIVLSAFGATEDPNRINAIMAAVAEAGLVGVYPDRRGETVVIAYGSYDSGNEPQAKADLEMVRGLVIDGKLPFAAALLVPPALTTAEGTMPEYDLSTLRARRGVSAMFTVQVAVYRRTDKAEATPEDLVQFRKAAEAAVVEYRRQGEEAFYYHTPRASTVTLGVFAQADFDGREMRPDGRVFNGPPVPSAALEALLKKHQFTLVNGQAATIRRGTKDQGRIQPSIVVEVPR